MHIAYNANTKSVGMKSNGKFMLKVLIWNLQFKQERQKNDKMQRRFRKKLVLAAKHSYLFCCSTNFFCYP